MSAAVVPTLEATNHLYHHSIKIKVPRLFQGGGNSSSKKSVKRKPNDTLTEKQRGAVAARHSSSATVVTNSTKTTVAESFMTKGDGNIDEPDVKALHEAHNEKHHHQLDRTQLHEHPRQYLTSLTETLMQRETVLGRYNHLTAESYASLGDVYMQLVDQNSTTNASTTSMVHNAHRAAFLFRASHRIHLILYGTTCPGDIPGGLRLALFNRGVLEADFSLLQDRLAQSVRAELEGDLLRRFGLKRDAAVEYTKAARIEEAAFGRENPDLAYLWRKVACLACIQSGKTLAGMNFDEMDRMSGKWFRSQSREKIHSKTCGVIKRGDEFYKSMLYSHAVAEYLKASTLDLSRSSQHSSRRHHRSSQSIASHKPSSRSHRQGTSRSSTRRSQRRSRSRSRSKSPVEESRRRRPENSSDKAGLNTTSQTSLIKYEIQSMLSKEERLSNPESSRSEISSHKRGTTAETAAIATTTTTAPSSSQTDNKEQELSVPQTNRSIVRNSLNQHVPNADAKVDSKDDRRPSSQQDLQASQHHPPVISTTKISRKKKTPTRTSSGSSMYQAIKQYAAGTKRSKNDDKMDEAATKESNDSTITSIKKDIASSNHSRKINSSSTSSSYLKKLASKASKTTRKASRALSASLHRDRDGGGDDDHDTDGMHGQPLSEMSLLSTPQSDGYSTYSILASPPPTPSPGMNERTFSSSSMMPAAAQLDEKKTGAGTSQSQMVSQDDDDSTYEDEYEDAEGSLRDQDQRSIATSSDHSFMTSDQSIKQRFLSETDQAAKTLEQNRHRTPSVDDSNNSEPPSLEDLCVHVKTMSAVLKRQAFRLQHRLGENSNDDPSDDANEDRPFKRRQQAPHSTTMKGMPKGHKALLREVERLFVECNETLDDAFERLDEVGEERRRYSSSSASHTSRTSQQQEQQEQQQLKLQEYRKTFTLERASIDRLRRSFMQSLQSTTTRGPSSSSGGGGSVGGGGGMAVVDKNLDRLSSSTMDTSTTKPISLSFASLTTTSASSSNSAPSSHRLDLDDSHKLSVVLEGAAKYK